MSFADQDPDMSGRIGSDYDAETDNAVAGVLQAYDADPEGMAGEVLNLSDNLAGLMPRISINTAGMLAQTSRLADIVMTQAAARQAEFGTYPNYPTTVTATGGGAGTFDSSTYTVRPLGSGTSDETRPLTLISILGFSTKANDTCECKILDILKNGAPQFGTAGITGGFFFERIRPVNLQGPYIRPMTFYGLDFKVGDTFLVRVELSAAGTYHFELDFCVRPYASSTQRAPSVTGGGTALALSRGIQPVRPSGGVRPMTAVPRRPLQFPR